MKYLDAFLERVSKTPDTPDRSLPKPTKPRPGEVLSVLSVPSGRSLGKTGGEPTPQCCGGKGVCDRAKDPQGRDLAHRIYSPVLGEHVWIARNRADAVMAGIIREGGEAVYYLDSDDVDFFRQDPEKVTMFKKAFLSPEIQ